MPAKRKAVSTLPIKNESPHQHAPPGTPHVRHFMPRVREAREAMRAAATEFVELYKENAKAAMLAGDHDVTRQSVEWFLEHMPPDDEGMRVIEQSIDKPKTSEAKAGPSISIGFAIGGLGVQKALPPLPEPTIEVKAIDPLSDASHDIPDFVNDENPK